MDVLGREHAIEALLHLLLDEFIPQVLLPVLHLGLPGNANDLISARGHVSHVAQLFVESFSLGLSLDLELDLLFVAA